MAGEWLCWPCRKYEEGQLAEGRPQARIVLSVFCCGHLIFLMNFRIIRIIIILNLDFF